MMCHTLCFMREWESWIRIILIGTSVRDLVTVPTHLFKPMPDLSLLNHHILAIGVACKIAVLPEQVMYRIMNRFRPFFTWLHRRNSRRSLWKRVHRLPSFRQKNTDCIIVILAWSARYKLSVIQIFSKRLSAIWIIQFILWIYRNHFDTLESVGLTVIYSQNKHRFACSISKQSTEKY